MTHAFEVEHENGLARVGRLKTKHGMLSTPVLFPVHNLGAEGGWNTPRYWEKFPHINTAMFNASLLALNRGGHLGTILQIGVHRFIRFFGVAFVDSGGFLYKKHRLAFKPEKILEIQEKMGADIASTLDYPINCKILSENSNILRTVNNAKLASSLKKNPEMLLFASINGYDPVVVRNIIKHLKKHGKFDGFAIGSLMPKYGSYSFLVDTILAARLEAGNTPIHVYGLGSPLISHLLIYLGVDSFDSSYFIVASGKRNYAIPGLGRIEFKDLYKYSSYIKCECPICKTMPLSEIRRSRNLITLHNLWALWNEIDKVKIAIKENRVEEYITERLSKAKWAKAAFEYAKRRVRFRFPGG
ncbi:MAG: tRNA-guanine transglycosylase [Candidatus Bathyarchaeia archaeon]